MSKYSLVLVLLVTLGIVHAKLKSACLGHNDCCTEKSPCPEHHGDCDNSNQCQAGLFCGNNNCDPGFLPRGTAHKFNAGDDCCERRHPCTNGDSDCCSEETPCDEGEGDCDFDSDCRGSLVCGDNNCLYPQLRGYDCCESIKVRTDRIVKMTMLNPI